MQSRILHILHFPSLLLATALCFISIELNAQTVQISVTNGPEIRCAGDSTVQILITPNPSGTWTEIGLSWGDGAVQILTPGDPLTQTHTYSTAMFLDDCTYTCAVNPLITGFCFQVSVVAKYSDILDENVQKILAFKIPPRPDFSATPNIPCTGDKVTFTNSTCPNNDLSMEYTWQFDGAGTDTLPDPCFTFDMPDIYSVTLTATNDCGTASISRPIQVLEPPTAEITPESGFVQTTEDTFSVCIGQTATVILDGTMSLNETSYLWLVSPPNITWVSPQDTSHPIVTFPSAGIYQFILEVNNACDQPHRDTVQVEVFPEDILQVFPQEDACLSLDYVPTNLNNEATYTLNGTLIPTDSFPLLLTPATYTLHARLDGICGMQETRDTFIVFAPDEVTIVSPTQDTSVCAGANSIILNAFPPDGNWIVNGAASGTLFNPQLAGDYLIEYVRGEDACERRDTVSISVQGITASIDPITACLTETTPIALNGTPAGGNWSSPECPSCVQNGQLYAFLHNGSDPLTVQYAVQDNLGCADTTSTTITLLDPVAELALDGPPCSNFALSFNTSGSVGNTFYWRTDGAISGEPATLPPGSHQVDFIAEIDGCKDSTALFFDIQDPPASAAFTTNYTEGCIVLEILFTPEIVDISAYNYDWIFEGGLPAVDSFVLPDIVFWHNFTGETQMHTTYLTVSNACGSVTDSLELTVYPRPVAEIGLDSVLIDCSPFEFTLTNRSTGEPDSCVWRLGNDITISDCSDFFTQTLTAFDSVTEYEIILDISSQCGMSSDTATVTVLPPDVDAFFNFPAPEVCPGTDVQFTDASTPIPMSWAWRVLDASGSIIEISNEPNPVFVFPDAGSSYDVILQVSAGCGIDTISHVIRTLPEIAADFQVPEVACAGAPVIIENLSPANYQSYIWQINDDTVATNQFDLNFVFDSVADEHIITLNVIDFENSCPGKISKIIEVRDRPHAEFSLASEGYGCLPLEVGFANLSQGATRFQWIFGDGQVSVLPDPIHRFEEGIYNVTLIASDGFCADTFVQEKIIEADPCQLYIPNVFSPNGDGVNDIFSVTANELVQQLNYIRIYTNWGSIVYEEQDLPLTGVSGWDGNFQGEPLNPGVFVYMLEAQYAGGRTEVFIGDVTLVR